MPESAYHKIHEVTTDASLSMETSPTTKSIVRINPGKYEHSGEQVQSQEPNQLESSILYPFF